MKKLSLLLIGLMSVLYGYPEIPIFEINSPDETDAYTDVGSGLQERLNAAQELIWVLPSNEINTKYAHAFWIKSMEPIIEHFTSIGINVRRVYMPYDHIGPDYMYYEVIGRIIDPEIQILSITRKKYYT